MWTRHPSSLELPEGIGGSHTYLVGGGGIGGSRMYLAGGLAQVAYGLTPSSGQLGHDLTEGQTRLKTLPFLVLRAWSVGNKSDKALELYVTRLNKKMSLIYSPTSRYSLNMFVFEPFQFV